MNEEKRGKKTDFTDTAEGGKSRAHRYGPTGLLHGKTHRGVGQPGAGRGLSVNPQKNDKKQWWTGYGGVGTQWGEDGDGGRGCG